MPIKDYPIYHNVSIAELKEGMNSLERLDDKFDFMSMYLLSHQMDEESSSCTFEELLHAAKEEFTKASIALRKEYLSNHPSANLDPTMLNPYGATAETEAVMTAFLADPTRYMKEMARSVAESSLDDPSLNLEEQATVKKWKDNCARLSQEIVADKKLFAAYEEDIDGKNILQNVAKKVYDNPDLTTADIIDRNKGGFFERMRGSTSRQYRDFAAALSGFESPDDPSFNNKERLRGAAMDYIRHKFPKLKPGELPTKEQIDAIKNPTAKGRILLTVAVVQEVDPKLEEEAFTAPFEAIDLDAANVEQQEFQQSLAEDLNEKADLDSSEIEENSIAMENKMEM